MNVCMYVCMHAWMYVCKNGCSVNISKPPPQPTPPPSSSSAQSQSSCSSWPLLCPCTFGRRRSQRSCWQGQHLETTCWEHLPYRTLWQPWGSGPKVQCCAGSWERRLSRSTQKRNQPNDSIDVILTPVPKALSSVSVEYLAELCLQCLQVMALTEREVLRYGCCPFYPKVGPKLKAMHGTIPQVTTRCLKPDQK